MHSNINRSQNRKIKIIQILTKSVRKILLYNIKRLKILGCIFCIFIVRAKTFVSANGFRSFIRPSGLTTTSPSSLWVRNQRCIAPDGGPDKTRSHFIKWLFNAHIGKRNHFGEIYFAHFHACLLSLRVCAHSRVHRNRLQTQYAVTMRCIQTANAPMNCIMCIVLHFSGWAGPAHAAPCVHSHIYHG